MKIYIYKIAFILFLFGTLSLVFNINLVSSSGLGVIFSDNFDDGIADGWVEKAVRCYDHQTWQMIPSTWKIMEGEYFCEFLSDPYGAFDTGVATVYGLNVTDCSIEVKIRFQKVARTDFNFRAGIVFRYIDIKHYYSFEVSDEYNCVGFWKYAEENPAYGVSGKEVEYPIFPNVTYTLRVDVSGQVFTGYVNGEKLLEWNDGSYVSGKVGLRARAANVFFDEFTVIDDKAPLIHKPIQEPLVDVEPSQNVKISVNVTDYGSRVKNVTLSYNLNNSAIWMNVSMTYNSTTGLYETIIPGQKAGTIVAYKIIAYDNVGNVKTEDNAGQYYTYKVVPEFPLNIVVLLFLVIMIIVTVLIKKTRLLRESFNN